LDDDDKKPPMVEIMILKVTGDPDKAATKDNSK
jgi:hypothetical protein